MDAPSSRFGRFPQGSAAQFCDENLPPLMRHQREEEDASLAIPSHDDSPSTQQNQSYRIIKDHVSEKSSHQSWGVRDGVCGGGGDVLGLRL